MKSVAMVTGEWSKRQKIIFHPQHSSFPFYKITPTPRQSNKQTKKTLLTLQNSQIKSPPLLHSTHLPTPPHHLIHTENTFFFLLNSTLTTTLPYLWIDFIVSIHSSSQMFTGSQEPGQTQEWPQFPVHPPSKSIYKYLPCEGACIPFPPKWPTFPRSSFHLKVGPFSPRPRLLMLVPDVSLLVFRPHQLLHSSDTFVLLDFIPSSTLPSNFPNFTDLHLPC